MSEFKLIKEIIEISEATIWDMAKLEWQLQDVYDDEDFETCLCGHYPIKEVCVIFNTKNHNTAIVGNCCVNKFLKLNSMTLFDSIKKIRRDRLRSVSYEMLDYAYGKHWITLWEVTFYADTIRKRSLSEKQTEVKYRINNKIMDQWKKQPKKETQ